MSSKRLFGDREVSSKGESPNPPSEGRAGSGTSSEYGSWVYAVARELDTGLLEGRTGVAGEALRTVTRSGLTAVVGSVPLSSFGDEALRRNFEDLDWLAKVARAHDAVVDAVTRAGPTVPLRLATVYLEDERVRLVLEHRHADFDQALTRVTGRTEWGVKALADPARLREPEPATRTSGAGAGAAYLRRRRDQLAARERGEQAAAEAAERIHAALAGLAVDAVLHRPHSPQLAGGSRPMILNAAYLVDDDAAREFARAVAALDEEYEEISLQLTGPWPPYSFSSLEEP
jgi:Gas vesicle synthesis protein GvpL/GvpF